MKTDQDKLDEVNEQLAEASDGATVVRLRARRAALEERLGYSFSGPSNRQHGIRHIWDEVKHPRFRGKFKAKLAQRKVGGDDYDPQALDHHVEYDAMRKRFKKRA